MISMDPHEGRVRLDLDDRALTLTYAGQDAWDVEIINARTVAGATMDGDAARALVRSMRVRFDEALTDEDGVEYDDGLREVAEIDIPPMLVGGLLGMMREVRDLVDEP